MYGTQGVVAQTAFPGVIALELLATGKLAGYKGNPEAGMFPAQAFSCDDFVRMQGEYGFPGGALGMNSEYRRALDTARSSRRWKGVARERPERGAGRARAAPAAGERCRRFEGKVALVTGGAWASGWRRRSGCSKREPPS